MAKKYFLLKNVSTHFTDDIHFLIKESSFFAKMAAFKLGQKSMAVVMGKTIHLHNCTSEEFLKNEKWLRHEMEHLRQFHQYGFIRFITLYLLESIRNGYYNNKFEVAARSAEYP